MPLPIKLDFGQGYQSLTIAYIPCITCFSPFFVDKTESSPSSNRFNSTYTSI